MTKAVRIFFFFLEEELFHTVHNEIVLLIDTGC